MFLKLLGLIFTSKPHYRSGSKSKLVAHMNSELETWTDGLMAKQQYRNGIFSKIGLLDRLRKMFFN